MPSGGARARSGPPPDPNALRRDRDKVEWIHLTARDGVAPPWPLTRPTARERELWERLWQKPQAVMWEAHDLIDEVALYVRTLKAAESPQGRTDERTLAVRLMTSLGINEDGLNRNRWIIDSEPASSGVKRNDPDRARSKARLKLLEDGAA